MNPILKYDKILYGLLLGIVIPVIAYAILLMIYDQLDAWDILSGTGLAPNFRERTIGLMAILANAIPMQMANNRYLTNAMRGIIFPTLFYVCLWMYNYGFELIGINV